MRIASPTFVALLLAALPLSAVAQVNAIAVTVDKTTLGSKDCSTKFIVDVDATLNGSPVSDVGDQIEVSIASASNCSGGTLINRTPVQVAGTPGKFRLNLTGSEIFAAAFPGATCPGTTGEVKTVFVCALFENEDETKFKDTQKIDIDTVGPSAPKLTRVGIGDRALNLDFQPAAGASSPDRWEVCFRQKTDQSQAALADGDPGAGGAGGEDVGPQAEDGAAGSGGTGEAGAGGTGGEVGEGGAGGVGGEAGEGGAGGTGGEGGTGGTGGSAFEEFFPEHCATPFSGVKRSFKLLGLQNHVRYQVAVRALDNKGNQSPFSAPGEGTPLPTDGFWERYKAAGGQQEGCSSASGAAGGLALALVAVSILPIAKRKRAGR